MKKLLIARLFFALFLTKVYAEIPDIERAGRFIMPIEYCRVLKAGNRDEILKINPKISEYTPYDFASEKDAAWYARGSRFKSDHLQGYNSLFYKELYCFRKECGVISFFDGMKLMSAHQTRCIPNGGCL